MVSAVLGAIGKRYIVEHQEAEDGSWWYDRYNNGLIVQGGHSDTNALAFPLEFRDTEYIFLSGSVTVSGSGTTFNNNTFGWCMGRERAKQTTGISEGFSNHDWIAMGYAA